MSTENKTKQELAAELCAEYKAKDDEVTRIKTMLTEAMEKRSDATKAMYDALGKGPFTYKGEYLGKIVCRGNTFFMRGRVETDNITVD